MSFRYLLNKYIKDPEGYPESVVYHDLKVVVIRDLYPKSMLHYLILTRSSVKTKQPPVLVFKDLSFKKEILQYVDIAKAKLVEEFHANYTSTGIDIEDFLLIGCHSVPSMNNLHVHLITRDFHSKALKNKKHYNSFNTRFFIPLEELPLDSNKTKLEEIRYDGVKMEKICKDEDLKCSYCGEVFTNKFQQLKQHLEVEFTNNFKKK